MKIHALKKIINETTFTTLKGYETKEQNGVLLEAVRISTPKNKNNKLLQIIHEANQFNKPEEENKEEKKTDLGQKVSDLRTMTPEDIATAKEVGKEQITQKTLPKIKQGPTFKEKLGNAFKTSLNAFKTAGAAVGTGLKNAGAAVGTGLKNAGAAVGTGLKNAGAASLNAFAHLKGEKDWDTYRANLSTKREQNGARKVEVNKMKNEEKKRALEAKIQRGRELEAQNIAREDQLRKENQAHEDQTRLAQQEIEKQQLENEKNFLGSEEGKKYHAQMKDEELRRTVANNNKLNALDLIQQRKDEIKAAKLEDKRKSQEARRAYKLDRKNLKRDTKNEIRREKREQARVNANLAKTKGDVAVKKNINDFEYEKANMANNLINKIRSNGADYQANQEIERAKKIHELSKGMTDAEYKRFLLLNNPNLNPVIIEKLFEKRGKGTTTTKTTQQGQETQQNETNTQTTQPEQQQTTQQGGTQTQGQETQQNEAEARFEKDYNDLKNNLSEYEKNLLEDLYNKAKKRVYSDSIPGKENAFEYMDSVLKLLQSMKKKHKEQVKKNHQ